MKKRFLVKGKTTELQVQVENSEIMQRYIIRRTIDHNI